MAVDSGELASGTKKLTRPPKRHKKAELQPIGAQGFATEPVPENAQPLIKRFLQTLGFAPPCKPNPGNEKQISPR